MLSSVGKMIGKKGLGFMTIANVGMGAYSFADEFSTAKQEGEGNLVAAGRGFAEAVVPSMMGIFKYGALSAAMAAPKMIMAGSEMLGQIQRTNAQANRLNAFNNANFQDTDQAYTMRQAGMAIAQRSRYNTQHAMMGNEARYMAK